MEGIKRIISIDLTEYGMEGAIEMRKPSLRRQNEFKNAVSKYIRVSQDRQLSVTETIPMGDLEILMTLQYISKAPFAVTLEGFLEYTDGMEPECAVALMDRMGECVKEIDESSPFVGSP